MGYYNFGPLHWEPRVQKHVLNSSNNAHLQYYVGGGGREGTVEASKQAVTVKTAARY
jgi:hypothetical protein